MMSFPFFIFQIKKNDFSFSSYTYKNKNTEDIASITSFHPTCIYKKTPNLSISSSTYMNIKGHQYPLKYIRVPMQAYAQLFRLVHMNSPIISCFRVFFFFINYDVIYIKNILTNLQVSFFISLSLLKNNRNVGQIRKQRYSYLSEENLISLRFFFQNGEQQNACIVHIL